MCLGVQGGRKRGEGGREGAKKEGVEREKEKEKEKERERDE